MRVTSANGRPADARIPSGTRRARVRVSWTTLVLPAEPRSRRVWTAALIALPPCSSCNQREGVRPGREGSRGARFRGREVGEAGAEGHVQAPSDRCRRREGGAELRRLRRRRAARSRRRAARGGSPRCGPARSRPAPGGRASPGCWPAGGAGCGCRRRSCPPSPALPARPGKAAPSKRTAPRWTTPAANLDLPLRSHRLPFSTNPTSGTHAKHYIFCKNREGCPAK